jgi:hypothetical protein
MWQTNRKVIFLIVIALLASRAVLVVYRRRWRNTLSGWSVWPVEVFHCYERGKVANS